MIIRSEHSFGPGYANSKIEAKWVASTHAIVTDDLPGFDESQDSSDVGSAAYCFAAEDRQQARSDAANQEREAEIQQQVDAATDGSTWYNPFTWEF